MEIIEKPWGHEEIWAKTDKYVGKILFIKKGEILSLQHHEVKEETIRVLSGQLSVRVGQSLEEALDLAPILMIEGDVLHITPGTIHRFYAPIDDVRVLEVSTTELDDVVRHHDQYGRA
jgi:mannose-6-phosphate isomerase-like protein (cupin superfamily)